MIRKPPAPWLLVVLFAIVPGCLSEGEGPGVAPPPADGTPTAEAPKAPGKGPRIGGNGQALTGMGVVAE